jgi:AraC-like DNA-binding protein
VGSDPAASVEWRRIVDSPDVVEQTRAYLRALGDDLRFEPARRRDRRVDVRIEGADLPSMLIHQVRCSGATIKGSPDRHYVLFLPLRGCIEANAGGAGIVCNPHRAAIFCPASLPAAQLRHDVPAAALSVGLTQAAMARQLTALSGEPVHGSPVFAPEMDLTQGCGQSLARYLLLAMADFRQAEPTPWTPIMISGFEDFIISKLLMSHPHNYATLLRRAEKPIAPRDVKRAIDFMQAQLGAPIRVADIAEASGIAGRTLFKHFQDYHGISPMRYLRNARFEKAREALIRAQPEESVTEIAMSWGFTHMGRFSVEYRKRFGESPSESLKRNRWRSSALTPIR